MSYQHILVPVDGSPTSLVAVEHAINFVKTLNSKITLVQVLTLDPYIAAEYLSSTQTNDLIERARKSILDNLATAEQKFTEAGITVDVQLLEGQVIQNELLTAAKNLNVDLIIMGSHGRTGLKKLFLGSVTQNILSETDIPVLVVRLPKS